MKRTLIPGRRDADNAHARPESWYSHDVGHFHRETELDNATPPRSWIPVRPAITVHRIPLTRRVRRILRALWYHLTAPRFRG